MKQLTKIFNKLSGSPNAEKIKFFELLLFELTIMNRAIWSEPDFTDKEKVECLKWSNELAHRTWNIISELKENQDENSLDRLWKNILFYCEQAPQLKFHIQPMLLSTFVMLHE